jgi:shikimate kinase
VDPRRAKPVFLIGMMGSGKSTIGKALARQCERPFFDLDREIAARSGVSVATIFELEGEPGFRKREAVALDELTQRSGVVVATGGGAVLLAENRERLRGRGLVIYLESTVDELARRTASDKSRPLLQGADPRARLEQLMRERQALYEATAHLTFHSGAANPRRLVKRIAEHPAVLQALAEPTA